MRNKPLDFLKQKIYHEKAAEKMIEREKQAYMLA
jgi:hypothetical protein